VGLRFFLDWTSYGQPHKPRMTGPEARQLYPPCVSGEASGTNTLLLVTGALQAPFPSPSPPSQTCSSCPRPVPKSCKNSVASRSPHPASTINSSQYWAERSIGNSCGTLNAMIQLMIQLRGLLSTWTRYIATSPPSLSAQASVGSRRSRIL